MSKNRVWKIISSQFLPLYPLYWPERFSSWGSHNENLGLVDQSRNPWGFSQKKLPSINGDDTNLGFDRHHRVTLKGSENVKKLKSVTFTDACVNSLNPCPLLNENLWFLLIKQVKQNHVHWDEWLSLLQLLHETHHFIRCEVCESSVHVSASSWATATVQTRQGGIIGNNWNSLPIHEVVSKNAFETHTVVSRW